MTWIFSYRTWALLALLAGLFPHSLMAQFPTSPTSTGPPTDAGGLFPGQQGFNPDSLGTDSTREVIDVKPDTRYIDMDAFRGHKDYLVPVGSTLEQSMIFDPLEGQEGFVQSLGQIGKPYQIFRFGLAERYFDLDLWRDPVLGHYDLYSLNPARQVRYYDSRTPYVDIWFTQGQRQLQVVDVTLSRSFGPSLNLTGRIRRPQSVGAYRNFVTDHTQSYLAAHFQSKKERYHAFTNVTFNRHNDQINGGVPRTTSGVEYPVVDGLIQEIPSAYNNSFFKENFSPVTDAQLTRKNTTAYFDQYYHLFGMSDSAEKKHRLTLRNTLSYDWQTRKLFDTGIDTTRLKNNLIPVFPTLADTTNAIEDSFSVRRLVVTGAASYSWLLASGWQANLSGGLNFQRIAWRGDSAEVNQAITEQFGQIRLSFPGGYLDGDVRQRVSNQFLPEQKVNAELALGLFGGKDSLATYGDLIGPVQFRANGMLGNLNPTLFQKTWTGGTGNAFRGNDSLRNEQVLHLRASLRWQGDAAIKAGDTLLSNYAEVGAFWSNRRNPVLYTQNFEVVQTDEGITRLGVTGKFRIRFLKHMHFETDLTYNPRLYSSTDETVDLYLRSVPEIHGFSRIYFDHRDLKIAREFRLGVGARYFSSYAGQTLEPISGQFFPTNYAVLPYTAGEAFFQLNIHGVFVYFRYLYLNENVIYNGYYTTPFYPMLERSFALGINWTFYN